MGAVVFFAGTGERKGSGSRVVSHTIARIAARGTPVSLHYIDRLEIDAEELDRVFPPRWRHPNKSAAWEKMQQGGPARGTLRYSRCAEIDAWSERRGESDGN